MKSYISFIIALFFLTNSFGQINFKADSSTSESNWLTRISHSIDSTFRLDKTYDFEFRLWTIPSLTKDANVFILTQKNNNWTGRFIEYNGYQLQKLSERKVNQVKIDSLWRKLIANQVLTLPTQTSIENKMRKYIADTLYSFEEKGIYSVPEFSDCTGYRFELLTQDKKRTYTYFCPTEYLTKFPNVEEFYRAFSIIVLVRKYIGLNLKVE